MFKLNSQQEAAVFDASKSLLIVAGPGTGKTRVLISKILHEMKARSVAPERILCITFSRRATAEIEDRLAEIDPRLAEAVSVSTLHSFCVEICKKHAFRLGLGKRARLLSTSESTHFLREISEKLPLLQLLKTSAIDPLLSDLFDIIAETKDAGLWPEDLMSFAQKLPEDHPQRREWFAIGEIYALWQSRAFEKGHIDFGDSLLMAERLLSEFRIVRAEEQSAFDLILVDEFQDTNWAQIKLLKSLCGDTTRIVAVGDDDQSIYRFRGASYSAFDFFLSSFPKTKVIELNETYRLARTIANAATEVIRANGDNRYKPDKQIVSLAEREGEVFWLRAQNEKSEAVAIAKKIEELITAGESPASIALLVRSHRHADAIVNEVTSRQIKITRQSRSDWRKSPLIRDIIAFFKVLIDPQDRVSYLRLLDSAFFNLDADIIFEIVKDFEKSKDLTERIAIDKILKEMTVAALRDSPSDLVIALFSKTDAIKCALEKAPEDLRLAGLFLSSLVELETLSTEKELRPLFTAIEDLLENSSGSPDEPNVDAATAVQILTIHASKGLEFDTVIMPSLVSRRFPSTFSSRSWHLPEELNREKPLNKETHLCEERRLFYVGMTRAKRRLLFSSFEKRGTRSSLFLTEDLKDFWKENPGSLQEVPLVTEIPLADRSPFERAKKLSTPLTSHSKQALSLSYTQIEKYETCPLSYRFKYEFRIPVKVPVQMALGSVIHEALENFFREIQRGEPASKQSLLHYFETAFKNESLHNKDLSETQRLLGHEKLSLYYDSYNNQWPQPLDIERDFVLPLGPHKIRGKIDRIDKVGDRVRIVDYKTGKAKSDARAEDRKFAEDSLQFSIYALAARDVFHWKMESLVFDYIYDCTKLSTNRSEESLDAVKNKILSMATQIQNREFTAKPGFHCDWCEYKSICPSSVALKT